MHFDLTTTCTKDLGGKDSCKCANNFRQYLQLRINGKQFDFPTHFAIPSHVLQVAKCLGAAKARLAKRLFHGKKKKHSHTQSPSALKIIQVFQDS